MLLKTIYLNKIKISEIGVIFYVRSDSTIDNVAKFTVSSLQGAKLIF